MIKLTRLNGVKFTMNAELIETLEASKDHTVVNYRSAVPPAETDVRACQCTFCRKHGATAISDANGAAEIRVREAALLERYRFGHGTADFYICRRCGVFVAAVMADGDRTYAVLAVNALDDRDQFDRPPQPMDFGPEDEASRLARRRARWTPTTLHIEG